MSADGSTALVTGGSGFIGTHFIPRLLSAGIQVRALVRAESARADRLRGLDVEIATGDLRDAGAVERAVRGVDAIYHLAALTEGSWDEIRPVNIDGTDNLVAAALGHGVSRFVHMSDIEIYDVLRVERNGLITEDLPCQTRAKEMSPYARSKIHNEESLLDSHRRDGLPVTIVRPGMVVGPLGQIFFPHLGFRYKNALFLVVRGGRNVLPVICVENLADGLVLACSAEQAVGEIYNLVDDGSITVRSYLEQLIGSSAAGGRIVPVPFLLPYLATALLELASNLGLSRRSVTSRVRFRWKHAPVRFDNSKARDHLGWRSQVRLEEGLRRAFQWYRDSLH
jgi:nucleoside-diphosphate-sugar epimerase